MNTNVNLSAAIGVMAFVGVGFLFLVTIIVLVHALVVRKPDRAKCVVLVMLLLAGAYLAATMIFSLTSHERVLAHGQEKHFREIDCHLAYSIIDTRQTNTIGTPAVRAQGAFLVVTIKTRFDETTISSHRGDGLLYPNSRVLTLIDARGNTYAPSAAGQRALETFPGNDKPFITPLRPGESYLTEVAFDLPSDAKPATLLISEGELETDFLIGHENSLLHRKTRFQI